MKSAKSILVFGCGELQQSIIGRAHKKGLFVVGIDPCADAFCKDDVDAFEVVSGQDFEGTCSVVEKYDIDAIVTAATDKPLVMMARIAEKYGFPFFSVDTARWSTDKYQMKQRFLEGGVPCAKGRLVKSVEEADDMVYPVIVKPRDNSGSRGVKLCRTREELVGSMAEALEYSKLDSVLVEEFIEGQEYSIEALHYHGKSEVIQFTEKKTTEFPYNVELGHKQPAQLTERQKDTIRDVVSLICKTLLFDSCASHSELRINDRGIFVIETSPRLGGDFITSALVPLSTGVNMEDQLLNISLGQEVDTINYRVERASGIVYFAFPEGSVQAINNDLLANVAHLSGITHLALKLNLGDKVVPIANSLDRYGEIIASCDTREDLDSLLKRVEEIVYLSVLIS